MAFSVHQCPFCELRFTLMAEVKDHIVREHKDHADGFRGVEVVELPPQT